MTEAEARRLAFWLPERPESPARDRLGKKLELFLQGYIAPARFDLDGGEADELAKLREGVGPGLGRVWRRPELGVVASRR